MRHGSDNENELRFAEQIADAFDDIVQQFVQQVADSSGKDIDSVMIATANAAVITSIAMSAAVLNFPEGAAKALINETREKILALIRCDCPACVAERS